MQHLQATPSSQAMTTSSANLCREQRAAGTDPVSALFSTKSNWKCSPVVQVGMGFLQRICFWRETRFGVALIGQFPMAAILWERSWIRPSMLVASVGPVPMEGILIDNCNHRAIKTWVVSSPIYLSAETGILWITRAILLSNYLVLRETHKNQDDAQKQHKG